MSCLHVQGDGCFDVVRITARCRSRDSRTNVVLEKERLNSAEWMISCEQQLARQKQVRVCRAIG
jgi:hypothetical protein